MCLVFSCKDIPKKDKYFYKILIKLFAIIKRVTIFVSQYNGNEFKKLQKIKIMRAITKVTLEKVANNFSFCKIDQLNGFLTSVVYLNDGGLIRYNTLLSAIGNHELDSWQNVERIKKSTSDKNKFNYVKQFEKQLFEIGYL
jgi:hypothetical protein